GGEACFAVPTAAMIAHSETADGPASIGCGAIVPVESTISVEVSGRITNYSGGAAVANADLAVFDNPEYDGAITTATTDVDGNYTATLPSGTPDFVWAKISADGFPDLFVYGVRPDLSQATLMDA